MEEKKSGNVVKTILLVFGIIFSVILVPGLILGIPVEGAAVALSQSVSQESIEAMVKEANLSENVYDLMMDEVEKELQSEENLNPEFFSGLVKDSVTVEFVDDIVMEFVTCMYNGSEPQLDLNSVEEGVKKGVTDLVENGFDDFYSACFEGTESRFFSDEFVQSSKREIETELLEKYSDFEVGSLEELETAYDAQFGAGAYDKLWEEEMGSFKEGWDDGFLSEVDGMLDDMSEELELEIGDVIREAAQDSDIRSAFDMLKEISDKKDTIKLVAYGIVLVAVLLLLVCYWFGTAGFVVPSVALILGGLLCKLVTLLENPLLNLVKEELMTDPEMVGFEDVIMDLFRGITDPFFAEMSKFGITMIGIGVLLVLLVILKNVVAKNMHVKEEVM